MTRCKPKIEKRADRDKLMVKAAGEFHHFSSIWGN
jgi:hypothetical protein